ncbi:MAG TPA: iron ABC transporter permease [Nitrospiria bacterium]|nr:iron ABC transporter permease [Nitrospiria bacterium]
MTSVTDSVRTLPGRRPIDGWRLGALAIAAVVVFPLAVVLSSVFAPADEVWRHLADTVLVDLLRNTFWLVAGVAVGTAVLGVGLAWITAVCEFPGRRVFDWALMLPLAIPAYVTAFVAVGLFDYTGPIQTLMRDVLPAGWARLPPIRSQGGVILVMSLALYPYVYLLARQAFLTQGKRAMEAAQALGHGPWRGFFHLAVPMARPWIVGGLALVVMETLADFGTVAVFNYDTFTTAIYKAWFGLFSLTAAAQLASILIVIVFALLLIERRWHAGGRYTTAGKQDTTRQRIRLGNGHAWLAFGACAAVLSLAFGVPVIQLLVWGVRRLATDVDARAIGFLWHSTFLGAMAAALTCACALVLAYAQRRGDGLIRIATRVSTLGYALPGSVLAVGTFIPLAWLDRQVAAGFSLFQREVGLVILGTPLAMLLAYLARFLAAGFGPIESAMHRVTPNVEEAARGLGVSGRRLVRRIHLPIIRSGVLTAATLVFVDVMKEMPATLMTRPFGWDTLSVRIFELTSEGQWEQAAIPSLALVLAGLLPVMLLTRHEGDTV